MKIHEFFQKYANLPLDKRNIPINWTEYGTVTLSDCSTRILNLQEEIRVREKQIQEYVDIAEPLLK